VIQYIKQISLKKWQAAIDEILQSGCLEEAMFIDSDQLIVGDFVESTPVNCLVQFSEEGYRTVCSTCRGSLCIHTATLLKCFVDFPDFFLSSKNIPAGAARLAEAKWMPYKKRKTKAHTSAYLKKVAIMEDGLDLANTLLNDCVLKVPSINEPGEQYELVERADLLRDFFLGGLTTEFRTLLMASSETFLSKSVRIYQILKSAAKFLADEKVGKRDFDSAEVANYLGYVWKLEDLRNMREPLPAKLILLSFYIVENYAAERLEETGIWLDLLSGNIHYTQNLRPFKALRHLKSESDACRVIFTPELYLYPGALNSRVRWDESSVQSVNQEDFSTVVDLASKDWKPLLKSVKKTLKNPLSQWPPTVILKFEKLCQSKQSIWLLGENEQKIELGEPEDVKVKGLLHVLRTLSAQDLQDACVLVRFFENKRDGQIQAEPLSLINRTKCIRLKVSV
jgi:hypothetical protein